jgi:hypothetical protein
MIPASERNVVRFIGRIFELAGCNNANPERLHFFFKRTLNDGWSIFHNREGIILRFQKFAAAYAGPELDL